MMGLGQNISSAGQKSAARLAFVHYLRTGRRLPESAFAPVGREYDTSGTDLTYRIPDARVGKIAFDMTLTRKTLGSKQIRGFFNADFKPDAVIIIRPRQLGPGVTYSIKRPGK